MRISTIFLTSMLLFVGMTTYSSEAEKDSSLCVMSYNIRYNNPGDGVNAWPNRIDKVAEMIGTKYNADLAGLQEALKGQIDDLASRLPEYAWFGIGRNDGKDAGEFTPIFYKKDRFTLLDHGTFWLSETPKVVGSKSWDAALTRIVTWGKFKDKQSRKVFYHYNTHFDHRGKQARIESARLIWRSLSKKTGKTPTVLTGDFNTRPTSLPYAVLVGGEEFDNQRSDMKDAKSITKSPHKGPDATFTRENWTKVGEAGGRIDYIFVRNGFSVLSHQIPDDQYDGRFPSDHLPVVAKLQVQ